MKRVVAMASIGASALAACAPSSTCKDICNSLATCGFLPSPLGVADNVEGGFTPSAVSDCVDRCDSSEIDALDLSLCQALSADLSATFSDAFGIPPHLPGWCAVPPDAGYTYFARDVVDGSSAPFAQGAPLSVCDDLKTCVVTAFGSFALGSATFEVGFTQAPTPAPAASLTCDEQPPVVADPYANDASLSSSDATSVCDALGVSSAKLFYEQSGQQTLASTPNSCDFLLSFGSSTITLEPGPVLAGVRVYGESYDRNPNACWVFYSRRTVLRAGPDVVLVNIDVPVINPKSSAGLIPCEVGEEACSNGVDDDLDGFVDCDDPDCRVLAMCNRPPSTADAATSDALMCDVQPDGDDATVSQASCP